MGKSLTTYINDTKDDIGGKEALEQEIARLFPSEEGGTVIRVKTEHQNGNPKKGIPEAPGEGE